MVERYVSDTTANKVARGEDVNLANAATVLGSSAPKHQTMTFLAELLKPNEAVTSGQ
jgi:hypothetical protein